MIPKLPEALRKHADLIEKSDDPDTTTALRWAASEIERYQKWVADLQSGMYVNCVYCGHRYGPGETTPVSMADALKAHIEQCPKHPMSELKNDLQDLEQTFDLRWRADQRAIKRWQEETGKELTWPDHADLVVWLMEKLEQGVKFSTRPVAFRVGPFGSEWALYQSEEAANRHADRWDNAVSVQGLYVRDGT